MWNEHEGTSTFNDNLQPEMHSGKQFFSIYWLDQLTGLHSMCTNSQI